MLSPHGRAQLRGLELADSLTLDPHKWLFQPLEAGCLLVRDGAALERTFSTAPPYLRDAAASRLGGQFRRPRHPAHAPVPRPEAVDVAEGLRRGGVPRRDRARASRWPSTPSAGSRATPRWELVTPARLGIVTFRPPQPARRAPSSTPCTRLPAAALADGFAYLSTHRVHGATALRLCTINPRTTRAGRRPHASTASRRSHKEHTRMTEIT